MVGLNPKFTNNIEVFTEENVSIFKKLVSNVGRNVKAHCGGVFGRMSRGNAIL